MAIKLSDDYFNLSDGNAMSIDDRIRNAFAVDGKVIFKGIVYDCEEKLRDFLFSEEVLEKDVTTEAIKKTTSKLLGLFIVFGLCTVLWACGDNSKTNIPTEYCEELVRLAEEGNAEAQFKLGQCYFDGKGIDKNEREAVKWITKAAGQGNVDGLAAMGNAYQIGIGGLKVNYEEAVSFFLKAAEKGHLGAMYNLGIAYLDGVGVTRNPKESFNWFLKAAEKGDAMSQRFVGDYYRYMFNEIGVSQDEHKAFNWYLKSAEQGVSQAQVQVGISYTEGLGTNQDLSKAHEWYMKAGEQNNSMALYNLGVMYLNGIGVSQDINKGLGFMQKSASLGNEGAKRFLQSY